MPDPMRKWKNIVLSLRKRGEAYLQGINPWEKSFQNQKNAVTLSICRQVEEDDKIHNTHLNTRSKLPNSIFVKIEFTRVK